MSFFNRNKRSDGRTGTTSFFKTRFTKTEIPAAPTQATPPVDVRPAPSYAHADRQTGPLDKEAEDREKQDESIREEKGKSKDDPEQAVTKLDPPQKAIVRNERHTGPSTSSANRTPKAFNRFWKLELEYDLEEEIQPETNYWTPNALAMFEILASSGKYVYDNATVLKRHTDYLDYAVAIYYSILFYIQILRTQKAAGKLRGPDRSFLNRFMDKFKFEELVVSSIMEPFFSTIVATLPKDGKYDWIVPDYSTDVFRQRISGPFAPQNGACYIQPMVPYMLRILKTATTTDTITAAMADPDNYFTDDDIFVTRALEEGAPHDLFGAQYQQNLVRADDRNTLFQALGVDYPFNTNLTQLSLAAPKLRKSKFKTFPYGAVAQGTITIDSGANLPIAAGSLDYFLHMEKTANVDFFHELMRQAALHARFFDGITNLSNIPTTSGNDPLVSCKFKRIVNGAETPFQDVRLGLRPAAAGVPEWYPSPLHDGIGSFYTSREGVTREESLQAMTFGTNATLPVCYDNTTRIGEGDRYRRGPYWTNKEWAATKFADSGINGKPMFRGWSTMFQDDAALEKPLGY